MLLMSFCISSNANPFASNLFLCTSFDICSYLLFGNSCKFRSSPFHFNSQYIWSFPFLILFSQCIVDPVQSTSTSFNSTAHTIRSPLILFFSKIIWWKFIFCILLISSTSSSKASLLRSSLFSSDAVLFCSSLFQLCWYRFISFPYLIELHQSSSVSLSIFSILFLSSSKYFLSNPCYS